MFGLFPKREPKPPVASILVIEDSEGDRALIRKTLERKNYSVILANDAEAGLKLVREHKIDLIILDYLLPGMNGVEVCKILKEDEKSKNIPIIFLTVVERGDAILECYGEGAESYMHKPINAKDLLIEIKSTILNGAGGLLTKANPKRCRRDGARFIGA